ncbi:MAG: hypothetical protein AAF842_09545 [Planctomycetota bacterium]
MTLRTTKPLIAGESEHSGDEINRAIRVPEELRAEDGRVFHVRAWSPVVCLGEIVTVSVELVALSETNGEGDVG